MNVLVYAFRSDSAQHQACRALMLQAVDGDEAYGMSSLVLSGFLRVVTHPRVFEVPDTLDAAMEFADTLLAPAHCVPVEPGPRHWQIFRRLCSEESARGAATR